MVGDGRALAKVVACRWVNDAQLSITLTEGRRRQVRNMCEQMLGMRVTELKRTRIGPIQMGSLGVGQWRFLSKREGMELLNLKEGEGEDK